MPNNKTALHYDCSQCKQTNPVDYQIARAEAASSAGLSECSGCLGAIATNQEAELLLISLANSDQRATFPGRIALCLEISDKKLSQNIDLVKAQMSRTEKQKNQKALRRLQLREDEYATARWIKFDAQVKNEDLLE